MKVLGVSVIAGAIAIIIIMLVLPINPGDIPPPIDDTIGIDDVSSIGIGVGEDITDIEDVSSIGIGAGEDITDIEDVSSIEIEAKEGVTEITDSVAVENKTDSDSIDQAQPKRYVINVTDVPGIG